MHRILSFNAPMEQSIQLELGFTQSKNFKVNYALQYIVIVCIHDVWGLYMLKAQHRKVRGQLLGASSLSPFTEGPED